MKKIIKIISKWLLILTLIFSFNSSVVTASGLFQSNNGANAGQMLGTGYYGVYRAGQCFLTSSSYSLTSVKVKM